MFPQSLIAACAVLLAPPAMVSTQGSTEVKTEYATVLDSRCIRGRLQPKPSFPPLQGGALVG
jgi:hypothetical protein